MKRNGCNTACEYGHEMCVECREKELFIQKWGNIIEDDEPGIDEFNQEATSNYYSDCF